MIDSYVGENLMSQQQNLIIPAGTFVFDPCGQHPIIMMVLPGWEKTGEYELHYGNIADLREANFVLQQLAGWLADEVWEADQKFLRTKPPSGDESTIG